MPSQVRRYRVFIDAVIRREPCAHFVHSYPTRTEYRAERDPTDTKRYFGSTCKWVCYTNGCPHGCSDGCPSRCCSPDSTRRHHCPNYTTTDDADGISWRIRLPSVPRPTQRYGLLPSPPIPSLVQPTPPVPQPPPQPAAESEPIDRVFRDGHSIVLREPLVRRIHRLSNKLPPSPYPERSTPRRMAAPLWHLA